MDIKDIQSTRKLYHLIKSKIKSSILAGISEYVILYFLIIIYKIKVLFIIKNNKESEKKHIDNYSKPNDKKNHEMIHITSNKKYDVSILVPVYNVEKYLERCIETLINQKTNYMYEIIFLNDGSNDSSMDILKKYEKFENVKIIEQKNQGLAEARNVLINNSNGKYIFFIDSDDILEFNAIDILMNEATKHNLDIVQCSYYKFNENVKNNIEFREKLISNDKYECMQLPGFAWGKLIKIELFENKRFPTGFLYEDTIIPFLIFSQANRVKILKECLYGYRVNINGIVNQSKNSIKCCDTAYIFEQVVYQMQNNNIHFDYDIYKFILNCQFSYVTYGRIKNMDINTQKIVFLKLCEFFEAIKIELNDKENIVTKNMEKSFKNKNFQLWIETSKFLNYCV